jgi:hypothetical protein
VWNLETFGFTATSATTTLSLIGKTTAGGDYIGLDNVDVEVGTAPAPVPEPATYTLLLTGMSLLGCVARKRLCR